MSMYSNSDIQTPQPTRASQACMSCRKQKRKCSKSLPSCALCQRMGRHCDYSDAAPAPTAEDFNALRMKLADLEAKLSGKNKIIVHPFAIHGGDLVSEGSGHAVQSGHLQHLGIFSAPPEVPWHGTHNRFPGIAFLDSLAFSTGGISVPKTSFDTPPEVLEALGGGSNLQAILTNYFSTIHQWMPIVSKQKLTRNISNPLWELGPDLELLYLCMKLIISRPTDGLDCSQSQVYLIAKRFIFLIESTGLVSLLVLQANILLTLYEYSHAIYPAAWMSSGWSIRYGNLLGISGDKAATNLLGKPNTWVEQEERRRTWWGVLLVDRIISIGNMSYILNPQEPKEEDILAVDDVAWDSGEISGARQSIVSTTTSEHVSPFSRLCQASVLLGQVMAHHKADVSSETACFSSATQLYANISDLVHKISAESSNPKEFFSTMSPLALTYSTLCYLCNPYSCRGNIATPEQEEMQVKATEGLKSVATSIVDFIARINTATPLPSDLDRVSPLVMDAIYAGASILAWQVRDSGDGACQTGLESLRQCLSKLSTRWRNAAEYVRILEAQEFAFALTQGTSS